MPGDTGEFRLRAGLIGYGMAGRAIHSAVLREAGSSVAHVVTNDPTRAAQARTDWPGVQIHTDVAGLLAATPMDVVVIASPTGRHVAHALLCLDAGVPVVVDKPLALDQDGAHAVLRRATSTGTPLTVFHNRRWDSERLTLARLLADGVLGDVHRFERRWERWLPVSRNRWREKATATEADCCSTSAPTSSTPQPSCSGR